MSLGSVLSIASSGLYAIQGQISVVSQNVANANSAGYTEEVAASSALDYGGQVGGVRLGAAARVTAPVLQASLYTQNASVSYQTTLGNALNAVTSVEGSTDAASGSTGSLTASLSGLESDLTILQSDPSSSAQQQSVLQSAQQVVSGINSLASTYAGQRQAASGAIADGVSIVNHSLTAIGDLSSQIVGLQAEGQSTAGLEDQRAAAMTQLSEQISVKFSAQPNGGMLVTTTSGTMLPTNATTGPLSYTDSALTPGETYDGTNSPVSNILLDGQDVTRSLTGGSLGANIALRDKVLPGYTAQIDSLAATLSQRFQSTGLPLFTDGSGSVPSSAVSPPAGFSSNVQLSGAATVVLAGSGTAVVENVAQYAFGPDGSAATPWPAVAAAQPLPYASTGTLTDFSTRLIASQGSDAKDASSNLADETAVQTALSGQIGAVSNVSIDSEMSKMVALQNSYQANAKVISAVQSMFTALLASVGA